jgi:hypothetical protein
MGSIVPRGQPKDTATQGCEPGSVAEYAPDQYFQPKWFAVYTMSRHEKRVDQHFTRRAIEYSLPLYESERK